MGGIFKLLRGRDQFSFQSPKIWQLSDTYIPIRREKPFPEQTTMGKELELKRLYLHGIILFDNHLW